MPKKTPSTKQTKEVELRRQVTHPMAQTSIAPGKLADLRIAQRAVASSCAARPSDIPALQRLLGNRATKHLIQDRFNVFRAGDWHDEEANRVAERAMSVSVSSTTSPRPVRRGQQAVCACPPAIREIVVQRWMDEEHQALTEWGGREYAARIGHTIDEHWLDRLAKYSTSMDYEFPEIAFNIEGWFWGKLKQLRALQAHYAAHPENARNHGEGGLYVMDSTAAVAENSRQEQSYLQEADRVAGISLLSSFGRSDWTKDPDRVSTVFQIVGDALHVAQDRGAHGDGAAGAGHAGQILTGVDPDDPSVNGKGYKAAQWNTYLTILRAHALLGPMLK